MQSRPEAGASFGNIQEPALLTQCRYVIMCSELFEQRNMYLDQILGERRSNRSFTSECPSEDEIRRILHAGLLAPFAAAAVGTSHDYFRRFFVMGRGSKAMNTVTPLVNAQVQRMADG